MPKKLTIEQFSEDIKNKFGDIYDFSQSKYTGINNKIKVICKKCGYEFYPSPGNLKSGHGCPNCYGNVKKTTEQFIKEAREVHGDKYDYSLVEYKKNHTPVKVICPIHGVWETMPSNHINKKRGC
ncbi:MAG: DUF723 domain-containing protein, partial [Elusimicrobiota bacterium]|nr:DUF723 domain-containing protein [Elusimicrobiota bacterium]